MNLSRFVQKDLFAILSIILIVCVVDQLYMMMEYKNISKETLIFTILLTGVSVFFGFLKKDWARINEILLHKTTRHHRLWCSLSCYHL